MTTRTRNSPPERRVAHPPTSASKPWGPALLLAAVAACQAPNTAETKARSSPVIVPAGGSSYLFFRKDGWDEHDAETDEATPHEQASVGLPCAAGVDIADARAAVAYPGALVTINLAERDVRWIPTTWSQPPSSLAVANKHALVLAGNQLSAWNLEDNSLAWSTDAGAWMKKNGIEQLVHALPDAKDPGQFVLVGFTPAVTRDPRTVVQLIDRSSGHWERRLNDEIKELTWLHAAASDGIALYLAGVHEENRRRPGTGMQPGDMRQTLIVLRIQLATLQHEVVVKEELTALDTHVQELVAGHDLVTAVLSTGQVKAWRVPEKGRASEVHSSGHPAPVSAFWLSDEQIAITSLASGKILQKPKIEGAAIQP